MFCAFIRLTRICFMLLRLARGSRLQRTPLLTAAYYFLSLGSSLLDDKIVSSLVKHFRLQFVDTHYKLFKKLPEWREMFLYCSSSRMK
jgi:hypothetical protein